MRTAIVVVTSLALAACAGCMSRKGGGMAGGAGFRIVVPTLGATVKQGETQTYNVSLHRGDYFKQDVRLQVKASEGISVEPNDVLIKASDKTTVHLRITAPRNAPLGDYKIYLTGTPEKGEPTSTDFTVRVTAP